MSLLDAVAPGGRPLDAKHAYIAATKMLDRTGREVVTDTFSIVRPSLHEIVIGIRETAAERHDIVHPFLRITRDGGKYKVETRDVTGWFADFPPPLFSPERLAVGVTRGITHSLDALTTAFDERGGGYLIGCSYVPHLYSWASLVWYHDNKLWEECSLEAFKEKQCLDRFETASADVAASARSVLNAIFK